MEITLEKIELVKDRTGVSYAEAKAALEKSNGSVVDAIIMIEEEIDISPKTKAGDQASQIVEKIKELVRKGNVSKILIKKGEETVLNIPVNIGILGIVFIPWVTIISVIAALGTKCSIELVKDNGEVVNLSGKAAETFDDVKSNYSVIADDLKEKGGDAFSQVKEKASSVINKMKKDYDDTEDDDYFNFDDFDDSVFDEDEKDDDFADKMESIKDSAEEKLDDIKSAAESKAEAAADKIRSSDLFGHAENIAEKVKEKAEDAAEKAEDLAESAEKKAKSAAEKAGDAMDDVKDGIEKASDSLKEKIDAAGDKFEETIEDYKAKKSKFKFLTEKRIRLSKRNGRVIQRFVKALMIGKTD